ncbi:MAG: hypothetical protein AAGA95_05825 [Pseudomonadota bacterium]
MRLLRIDAGHSRGVATVLFFVTASMSAAAQEPYRFYGGDVDSDGKTPAMEACEYEELVEKQRCNRSLNKSSCIDAVRRECRERVEGVDNKKDGEARQR